MDCIEIVNRFKHKRVFSTEEYNLRNKALHEYHVKYGYEKGKRPKISKTKRKRIFKKCNDKCVYCGKQLTLGTFDACRKCNSSKGTKLLSEWEGNDGK